MQTLKRASTANTDLPIKLPPASAVRPKGAARCGLICGKKERKAVYQRKRSKWVVAFVVSERESETIATGGIPFKEDS